MAQYIRKQVFLEQHSKKELKLIPKQIQEDFIALFRELRDYGFLEYPEGKKLQNYNLFEGRINDQGIWRCLYAYTGNTDIVILCIFRKKTQKTPRKEIQKALTRLNNL